MIDNNVVNVLRNWLNLGTPIGRQLLFLHDDYAETNLNVVSYNEDIEPDMVSVIQFIDAMHVWYKKTPSLTAYSNLFFLREMTDPYAVNQFLAIPYFHSIIESIGSDYNNWLEAQSLARYMTLLLYYHSNLREASSIIHLDSSFVMQLPNNIQNLFTNMDPRAIILYVSRYLDSLKSKRARARIFNLITEPIDTIFNMLVSYKDMEKNLEHGTFVQTPTDITPLALSTPKENTLTDSPTGNIPNDFTDNALRIDDASVYANRNRGDSGGPDIDQEEERNGNAANTDKNPSSNGETEQNTSKDDKSGGPDSDNSGTRTLQDEQVKSFANAASTLTADYDMSVKLTSTPKDIILAGFTYANMVSVMQTFFKRRLENMYANESAYPDLSVDRGYLKNNINSSNGLTDLLDKLFDKQLSSLYTKVEKKESSVITPGYLGMLGTWENLLREGRGLNFYLEIAGDAAVSDAYSNFVSFTTSNAEIISQYANFNLTDYSAYKAPYDKSIMKAHKDFKDLCAQVICLADFNSIDTFATRLARTKQILTNKAWKDYYYSEHLLFGLAAASCLPEKLISLERTKEPLNGKFTTPYGRRDLDNFMNDVRLYYLYSGGDTRSYAQSAGSQSAAWVRLPWKGYDVEATDAPVHTIVIFNRKTKESIIKIISGIKGLPTMLLSLASRRDYMGRESIHHNNKKFDWHKNMMLLCASLGKYTEVGSKMSEKPYLAVNYFGMCPSWDMVRPLSIVEFSTERANGAFTTIHAQPNLIILKTPEDYIKNWNQAFVFYSGPQIVAENDYLNQIEAVNLGSGTIRNVFGSTRVISSWNTKVAIRSTDVPNYCLVKSVPGSIGQYTYLRV